MKHLFKQRAFWLILLTILTVAALLFVSKIYFKPTPLKIYGAVKNFQLTERSGKMVSMDELKGRVWIADFIFTRCAGICPMMSSKMRTIQERFKNYPDIRFVSFSVDPEHDTPEVLSEYATHFNADPQKWFFLTGDKDVIFKLSEQHFYLGVSDIPVKEREAPDQSVNHSSKFVLVDPHGQIRGYYDTEEDNFLEPLVKDVNKILEEH